MLASTHAAETQAARGPRTEVVVQLAAPPLARASGVDGATRRIDAEQRRFTTALRRSIPEAAVRWRYRLVANGLAVVVPRRDLARLSHLPGVKQVFADVAYHALAGPDAMTIHARDLPDAPLANAGAGIKIGIIDDGVDQKHAFFDPSGYTMPAGFPKGQAAYTTAKVIVARAFPPAGATWKYAGLPFDPDDSGHATHVAGIAAGNANTLANGLRISGIAPRAYIGNYKALTIPTRSGLGLNGNAPEIVAAIEAAVADGMDVINLSLGEPEIQPSRDIVALALDAAAAAGVVPVVAAGNDFDDFGPGSVGSPGSAADAITVGATTSGTSPSIASFSSAGPTPISLRLKPDVVAPGTSILSSQPDGWGLSSGTSMATPHVAGAAGLLLQRHPDWSPGDVKAALTVTARPVAGGDGQVAPTRAGAGLVDVAAADTPAIEPTPTAVSFGLVRSETITSRSVAVEDVGGGAGQWTVSVELSGTPSGTQLAAPPTITVPGPLPLDLVAGSIDGEISGAIVLRRASLVRRIPIWGRVEIPKLAVAGARTLQQPGIYTGDTRGRPSLVDTYRYPEVPADGPVSSRLAGPEQVFRVRLTRPVANFGVAIVGRGPGSRVEPRVVRGGDENRLTGYAALPFDQNPYVTDFGSPVAAAGALRPSAGTYYVVFDSPTAAGGGSFRFRFWIDDVKAPNCNDRRPNRPPRGPDPDPSRRRWLWNRRHVDRGDHRRTARTRPPGRARDPGRDRVRRSRAPSTAACAVGLSGDAQQRERAAHPAEHAHRLRDRHDRRPLTELGPLRTGLFRGREGVEVTPDALDEVVVVRPHDAELRLAPLPVTPPAGVGAQYARNPRPLRGDEDEDAKGEQDDPRPAHASILRHGTRQGSTCLLGAGSRRAALEMVVDEAHRLHERVDRRRADERPAAALELLRKRPRRVGVRELEQCLAGYAPRPVGGGRLEAPDKGGERALRFDQLERPPRVVDRRLDLPAVAHDRRVTEEPLDVALAEPGDPPEVEACERAPEGLALAQDRQPREARLEALERELLEQPDVVADRQPPLVVVVGAIGEVVAPAPPAPDDAVLVPDKAVRRAHRTTISISRPASGTPPPAVTSQVSCM